MTPESEAHVRHIWRRDKPILIRMLETQGSAGFAYCGVRFWMSLEIQEGVPLCRVLGDGLVLIQGALM